jgi:carbon monoxide dehydrogenase subunit G
MNIHGHRQLVSPPAAVFAAICDPAVLMAVIPGCEDVHLDGDAYRGRIVLRLPGMTGAFETTVRLVDGDPPTAGRLEGEMVGRLGSVRGSAAFHLTGSDGGTLVAYDGQATLGGPLARLDHRFAEGLAASMIGQGLGSLDARLQHGSPDGVRAVTDDHITEDPA